MEEQTEKEKIAVDQAQLEADRRARNAAAARERVAKLNAMGLSARGNPLRRGGRPKLARAKRRDPAKQRQYQANFMARHKAARERLGLTIAQFSKLPKATRMMEMKRGLTTASKERARAQQREWYHKNKEKVMAARRAKASNGTTAAPAASAYNINECPNCGCPIRALTVALRFEEERKHGSQ